MKKFVTLATAAMLSLLLMGGVDAMAQRGNTSTSTSTRRSGTTTSSSSTRQSGTAASSSSSSSTRQSGTSTRQSSSSTRQSGTTSTSASTTRQNNGTSTSRQSGSTSRQSTTTTSSSTRQSGSATSGSSTRQSGSATSGSSTRQSGSATSGSSTRQSGSSATSGSSTRQSGGSSASTSSGSTSRRTGSSSSSSRSSVSGSNGVSVVSASDGTVRSNSNVTKKGLGTVGSTDNSKPADGGYKTDKYGNYRDNAGNYRYGDGGQFRLDDHYNAFRTPPRDRGFIDYGRPGYFYADKPHYFGYRVERLPARVRLVSYFGINYYLYNGVYYRPYGSTYVICRPPFGTYIDIKIGRGPFNRVRFSYYTDVYRSFDIVDANYRTIAEQNRIIAMNNATIARQNNAIALNSSRAGGAYELAARLGLVQSYAGANLDYFYQDGVFYAINGGRYQVIVPPAGALVDSLPDDYDVITIGGVELYKVDDTVYRLTLVDGVPYLEVLGQMYGSLASQYNYYGR